MTHEEESECYDRFFAGTVDEDRIVVRVPSEAATLFVPRAKCGGSPAMRRAGVLIRPPPPAIESINPAKNIHIHNIINSIFPSTLYLLYSFVYYTIIS